MKKILFSILLASSISLSAAANPTDPVPQVDSLEQILSLLQAWADLYPQCYESVAFINNQISGLQMYAGETYDELSSFHGQFSTFAQDFSSYYSLFNTAYEENKNFLNDISSNVRQLSLDLYTQNESLLPALSEIVATMEKLPDFGTWTPNVYVSNFTDLKEVLREIFGDIVVNCHLDADTSFDVNANIDFNYDYFLPIKQFNEKANRTYFTLNNYTRYIPNTWIYKSEDSIESLINPTQYSAGSNDFLDFLCHCGNALVAQNDDISVLLCQLLGFFKSGHGDSDELKQRATSAADDATKDLDSLTSAFNVSSVEAVASAYFVDLNIDDKFDSDFLGFAHGSGATCPDYIEIGPIPFSKIHSSMSDYTLRFPTADLKSFFDVCRQCFTVVWYLFFLTICIFLARFGWAFLKPIFRTLTDVLNW